MKTIRIGLVLLAVFLILPKDTITSKQKKEFNIADTLKQKDTLTLKR